MGVVRQITDLDNSSAVALSQSLRSWSAVAWELYAKSQIWTTPHQSEV